MIKCTTCDNHQHTGIKHTCKKCKTKIVFGELQELLIEHCPYFVKSEKSFTREKAQISYIQHREERNRKARERYKANKGND